MAQENSVSFKCYLQYESLNEVRRFGVDKDAVCNFSYLKGKLQTVFPSLQGRDFTVSWKDSDGDEVVISSDDELMIALTEQQTEVRKLYVSVKPGFVQEEQTDGEGRPQHFGVTCDGCNKGVEGFRYKCIQCSDYDLCATCEWKGMHSQHYMIRMPVPTSWRPIFGKRLAHHLSKAAHKASRMDRDGCPFGDGRGEHWQFEHRGGHHDGHHGGRHHRRHGGWLDTLAAYLNDWSLPDDDDEVNVADKKDEAAGPSNRKQAKTTRKQAAQVRYLEHIGKTVCDLLDPLGINVAVEVRTNDEDGNTPKAGTGNEKEKANEKQKGNEKQKANEKENGGENVTEEQASTMEIDLTQDKDGEPQQSHSEHDQSPEAEGWTVLSPQQSEPTSQEQSTPTTSSNTAAAVAAVVMANTAASEEAGAAAISAQTATTTSVNIGTAPKQPTVFTSGNSGYHNIFTPVMAQPPLITPMQPPAFSYPQLPPTLMHNVIQPPHFIHSGMRPHLGMRAPAAPAPAPAPPAPEPMQHALSVKPHVAEAVEKMMSMGFSNDGGWLTQLLESKDGDIIKALDVLQPVKRS